MRQFGGIMTAPTAHHLRLTIRIHADSFHKEADVALPLSSSLGELMAELTDLVDAPAIASPWRASTASGRTIDLTAPLAATPLAEGSILVLTPREERPAPVIRDAAESLAAQSHDDTTSAIPIVWAWAGLAAAFAVAWVLSLPTVACSGLAIAAFVLALWTRALSLVMLTLAAGAASGWALISPALADAPYAALTTSATLLAALLACHLTRLSTVRITSGALTIAGLVLIAAVSYLLPGLSGNSGIGTSHGTAAAAGAVIAGVIMLATAPALTIATAGLKVPQLPTAGQDLAVSDELQPDVDDRATRAGYAYEGICCAIALCLIPALIALSFTGAGTLVATDGTVDDAGSAATIGSRIAVLFGTGLTGLGFVQALCVSVAGTVVMHAARHGRVLASWALMLVAMVACLTACLCAVHAIAADGLAGAWAPTVVAALLLTAMLSAPLWTAKMSEVEPTTIAWFERIESLTIAACLPLAAHLAGIFELIRGLG